MNTLSIARILTDGILLSVVLGLLILGSFRYNAGLWLNDFPKEVQAAVPPLTPGEKRQRWLLMIPFLIFAVGIPLLSTRGLRAEQGGSISFISALANTYLVFMMFNLFDLLVIDYFIGAVLKPKFTVLAGAESLAHLYQNFHYHFKDFWKAVVGGVVFCLPIALAATL